MYKHRAKVVRCQYVYRFFHVYCTIKERAKVLIVMLSWCVLSWWARCIAVVT